MVKINIKQSSDNFENLLKEQIVDCIRDTIIFTNVDVMISNVNKWYNSCGSELNYTKSNGYESYINTSCIYRNYSRKYVYEVLINYLENIKESPKYFVAIPAGSNNYVTLIRSTSGNLMLGDKTYTNTDVIKRHNSYVPGGITMEEVKSSKLSWCIPFMEKIDE